MSRPRRPYGPNPPGRLQATMVKVLAAELSDAGRLSRGKRYWADDAVVDIVIGHGAVTAEVQGGRADPYVVTVEADPGSGVPSKREIWIGCTCPDDTGAGDSACKHAVAALFALSDEIAIDPAVIDRWRASRRRRDGATVTELPRRDPALDDSDEADEADEADDGSGFGGGGGRPSGGAEIIELHNPRRPPPEPHDPSIDEIGRLLASPTGHALPELPVPEPFAHPPISSRLLTETLHDALDHLAIRWE